jgi:hypothetical protein
MSRPRIIWLELRRAVRRWWCEVSHHDADIVSWHRGLDRVPAHFTCMACGSQSRGWR